MPYYPPPSQGGDGGAPVSTVIEMSSGTGVAVLGAPQSVVQRVVVDEPVRIRFYSTEEGRDADIGRSVFTPYPGGRYLAYELNATESGTFEAPFLADSPLFWTADASAVITLTWRSIA